MLERQISSHVRRGGKLLRLPIFSNREADLVLPEHIHSIRRKIVSRQKNRFLTLCAAATTALMLAGTAQAADLRSWDMKINDVTKRFIVLPAFKSQAVLDKETQLVWQRTPDSIRTAWQTADWACMNASTGGRKGWRLPSRSEFMSLIDPAASPPIMLPAGHPFSVVTAAGTGYYWTSDPSNTNTVLSAGQPKAMANIYLATGGVYYSYMSSNVAIAWCVRGHGE